MPTTTIRQKFFLLIFGIFATLLVLEIGLRIGGAFFSFRQDLGNRAAANSGTYRILCIGESTTALGGGNSYPSQLESILTQRFVRRQFKVINKGLVSKTSQDILSQLKENLDRYKPQLVIAMIGINDNRFPMTPVTVGEKIERVLERSRVYKLFKMIKLHLKQKLVEKRASPNAKVEHDEYMQEGSTDASDSALEAFGKESLRIKFLSLQLEQYQKQYPNSPKRSQVEQQLAQYKSQLSALLLYLGRNYRIRKDFVKAEKYLAAVISESPNSFGGYLESGSLYKDEKDYARSVGFLKKAVAVNPNKLWAYLELARVYDAMGLAQEAFATYQTVLEKKPDEFFIFEEIARWFKDHQYLKEAEQVYRSLVVKSADHYLYYDELAQVLSAENKKTEAEYFFGKSRAIKKDNERYLPETVHNYHQIAEMVINRGIRFISMQYPLQDLEPLKRMLSSTKSVIFVENKTNFQEVLKHAEYSEYFYDSFATTFGHCTRLGNQLIAENLTGVIKDFLPNAP